MVGQLPTACYKYIAWKSDTIKSNILGFQNLAAVGCVEDKPNLGGHDVIDRFVGDTAAAASIGDSAAESMGRQWQSQRFHIRGRGVSRVS